MTTVPCVCELLCCTRRARLVMRIELFRKVTCAHLVDKDSAELRPKLQNTHKGEPKSQKLDIATCRRSKPEIYLPKFESKGVDFGLACHRPLPVMLLSICERFCCWWNGHAAVRGCGTVWCVGATVLCECETTHPRPAYSSCHMA